MPLIIGEAHTGLLQTSAAVPTETTSVLLGVRPGDTLRIRQRPVRYAWSPEVLTGVDCHAPIAGHREVRVVGTLATCVSLTDGHIIQAYTYATLQHEPAGRRRPWSHYLSRPGILEVLGAASEQGLAEGFLSGSVTAGTLNIGAVNIRAMAAIQRSKHLDHRPPFRSRRTRLRWSAEGATSRQEMAFTLKADGLRSARLRTDQGDPRALAEFCADLALHDWLLSALLDLVNQAMDRSRPAAELIRMLRPGIDHLVHAWMPSAHADKVLMGIWQDFDRKSGSTLQWQRTVERIRDQLSIGIIEALHPRPAAEATEPA